MAKLSARNAHEVAKIRAYRPADAVTPAGGAHYLWAYRSDGKVLARLTRLDSFPRSSGGQYRIIGTASEKAQAAMRTGPLTFDHVKVREFLAYLASRRGQIPEE